MRWLGRRRSVNVEDRRGMSRAGMFAGGGLGTLILIVVAMLFGVDPRALLQLPVDQVVQTPTAQAPPENDEMGQFVSVVLAETEDVWRELFAQAGSAYREPTLVLFTDRVQSACGIAGSAVGPFYCGADQKVYIDLAFYRDLRDRFGAPGDFAQAYVIAHEVGHHVQNLTGTMRQAQELQGRVSREEANAISVRLELQADFYAGVWAHHAERAGVLEPGDLEEALRAAAAIGDDRLQRQSQGTVVPESFTHGTSEQRMRWFRLGYESGDPSRGDTFAAQRL